MATTMILDRRSGLSSTTGQALADDLHGETLDAQVQKLGAIIDAAQREIERIHHDGRRGVITGKGIGESLAAVSEGAAKRILDVTAASRKAIDAAIAKADDVLTTLREDGSEELRKERRRRYAEIRQSFLRIDDDLKREAAIRSSVLSDDLSDARETVAAIQEAHAETRRSLIRDDALGEIRQQFLRRAHPDTIRDRSAARTALGVLVANQEAALRAVGASRGLSDRLKHDRQAAATA